MRLTVNATLRDLYSHRIVDSTMKVPTGGDLVSMNCSNNETTPVLVTQMEVEREEMFVPQQGQRGDNEMEERSTPKKRTWKKPKDKPKRPLSAYNIFFQHARARVVEGINHDEAPEEVIRILSKSQPKRRHRKSHGKISFGDLARTIADQWRSINPKLKSIFDHYAEIEMVRYRRELKVWKDKQERETEAASMEKYKSFSNQLTTSFSSSGSTDQFSLEDEDGEGVSSDASSVKDTVRPSQSYGGISSSVNATQESVQANMPNSHLFQTSLSDPSSTSFEAAEMDTEKDQILQQLRLQQAFQINRMRELQIQQLKIQQQLELHGSGNTENRNMMSLGQASLFEQMGNTGLVSQQHQHRFPNQQGASFAYLPSMDQGMNLYGTSVFDSSSSNGFISNSISGMNSSSLMNGYPPMMGGSSIVDRHHPQSLPGYMPQRGNNFGNQGLTHLQIGLGAGGGSGGGGDFGLPHGLNENV